MTLDWVRLTWRLGRFELVACCALVLGAVGVAFGASYWLDTIRPPAGCFDAEMTPASCRAAIDAWSGTSYGTWSTVAALVVFVSLAAGLFLGVPIVARELERGTTRLAWSLALSRRRWYLERLVPNLVAVAVISCAAGIGVDRIVVATDPGIDLNDSFVLFGFRGILLAGRAVFLFAVAVLVGAAVARTLPGIIIACVVGVVGMATLGLVHQTILGTEAVPIDEAQVQPGDLTIDRQFRLPDGSLVAYEPIEDWDTTAYDEDGNAKYPVVVFVVPGGRFQEVEAREALVLFGSSLVALTLGAIVVAKRQPG